MKFSKSLSFIKANFFLETVPFFYRNLIIILEAMIFISKNLEYTEVVPVKTKHNAPFSTSSSPLSKEKPLRRPLFIATTIHTHRGRMERGEDLSSFVVGSVPTVYYIPDFITDADQQQLLNNVMIISFQKPSSISILIPIVFSIISCFVILVWVDDSYISCRLIALLLSWSL